MSPSTNLVVVRNNVYINQTFGVMGVINIIKNDIVNMTVVVENNYFESIINLDVAQFPMISI